MRRLCFWVLVQILAVVSLAHAQYGAPVQGPPLDPQGTARLRPSLGVVHDAEFETTGAALVVRGRYALLDELALDAHFGGLVGQLDTVQVGAGVKAELLSRDAGFPLDLVAFSDLDLAFGDSTLLSWLSGPLFAATFELDGLAVTPYGGIGLGLTRFGDEIRGSDVSDETELALGFIAGADVALSRDLSAFTEFTFGATDGLPSLSWHIGASYVILSPPEWHEAGPIE